MGAAERPAIASWLERVRDGRDLTLPPPDGVEAAPILAVLATLSAELREYRAIVAQAREAAQRNAAALAGVARSTDGQQLLVAEAAGALDESEAGAVHLATAASGLGALARDVAAAAERAAGGLGTIDGALETLHERLDDTRAPLQAMDASAASIHEFLDALQRLSTRAQVLAVNAAVEAAHAGSGTARFEIVATEIRRLSASTASSARNVAEISAALEDASARVSRALGDADASTRAAAVTIAGARTPLEHVREAIAALDETIAALGAIAAQQSASLESVLASMRTISAHADQAAAASRAAAEFDLDAMLTEAARLADAWRLCEGTGGAAATPIDPEVREMLGALVEAVNADERAILSGVVHAAMAVARNVFSWKTIAESLANIATEIEAVRRAVGESVSAARGASETASRMRAVVERMERSYESSLGAVDGALGGISAIVSGVDAVRALADAMTGAAERAGALLGIIDNVSVETSLLSLNAAVESARAGQRGRSFNVIAREIRTLADRTHASTAQMTSAIARVAESAETMRAALTGVTGGTDAVDAGGVAVRSAFDGVRGALAQTVRHALDVSATAEQQSRSLERVLELVASSAKGIDSGEALATDAGRVELVLLSSRAHEVAARRPIGLVAERIRTLVERVAVDVEAVLEDAVDRGALTLEELFTFTYVPIEGDAIAPLGRLFDVRRVPRSGFVPAKYATPWDHAVVVRITEILERARVEGASCNALAVVASDLNSFVYAFSRPQTSDWTGDPKRDALGNRVKRLNEDEVLIRNARLGLGARADGLGLRQPYEAFVRAGCTLSRDGERPWRTFVYARDTSQVFNEMTTALYVKGRRHGNLRFIYGAEVL